MQRCGEVKDDTGKTREDDTRLRDRVPGDTGGIRKGAEVKDTTDTPRKKPERCGLGLRLRRGICAVKWKNSRTIRDRRGKPIRDCVIEYREMREASGKVRSDAESILGSPGTLRIRRG